MDAEKLLVKVEKMLDTHGSDGILHIPTSLGGTDLISGDQEITELTYPIKYVEDFRRTDNDSLDYLSKFEYTQLLFTIDEDIGVVNETCYIEGHRGDKIGNLKIKPLNYKNSLILYTAVGRATK